jgi:hypothetical protein
MTISVVPAEIHPNAMFLRGLQASAHIITARNNFRVGYVHSWSYASIRYQSALETLIAEGPTPMRDLRGVTPTIEFACDPRNAAGSDPQLERAVQILSPG